MAATIEVNYFNSFWLKKVVKNGDTDPSWPGLPWNPYGAFSVAISAGSTGYSSLTDVTTTRVSGTGRINSRYYSRWWWSYYRC